MNIPIFRAKKKNGKEYITGNYIDVEFSNEEYVDNEETEEIIKHCIIKNSRTLHDDFEYCNFEIEEIDISTLSIHFPDMLDSQGNKMFASLQSDGKGGDLVSMGKGCINRTLVYKYGQFWFTDFSNNQLNSNTFSQVAFNLHFNEKFNLKNRLRNYLNEIEVVGVQQ